MDRAQERILELKNKGLTHRQVAEKLNEEKILTARGGTWTPVAVQQRVRNFMQAKKRKGTEQTSVRPSVMSEITQTEQTSVRPSVMSEISETEQTSVRPSVMSEITQTEQTSVRPSVMSDDSEMEEDVRQSDTSEISETVKTPEDMRTFIIEIVHEEMMKMQSVEIPTALDLPPKPTKRIIKKTGRPRTLGKRLKLGVTVDKALFERFEKERKKLGISASAYLDALLWNAYGRPRLSYEPDEDAE